MKFNFKKVVPIVTGALLLGSTIGFAAGVAGQAATYPSSFADSVVVIGSASADSAAAADIAADLGKLTTSSSQASVSEGHLVAKGSNELNYGEDWADLDATLDDSDLPTLLADGVYKDTKGDSDNEVDYEQSLTFYADGEQFLFDADENDNDKIAPHLMLSQDTAAYNYTVKFTTEPEYNNASDDEIKDDFQFTKLSMLGDEWTFTDASASGQAVDKLTFMGGAAKATLKTGESSTLTVGGKSYTIVPTVYEDKVQFLIDGQSLSVDEGATDTLDDGTNIGVAQTFVSGKEAVADQVEFFLGARKLILEDGKEVNLNGQDIDGTEVQIDSDGEQLNEFSVWYTPEDDAWLSAGKSWTDPVFGKFKFVFASVNSGTDTLTTSTGTDTGSLKVKNSKGKDLDLKLFDDDDRVYWGAKYSKANLTAGGVGNADGDQGNLLFLDGDKCEGTTTDRCEGLQILAVDADGEARIYELTNVDEDDNKLTLTDRTNGNKAYERDYTPEADSVVDVGLMDLTVNVSEVADTVEFVTLSDFAAGQFRIFSDDTDAGKLDLSLSVDDAMVELLNGTDDSLGTWNYHANDTTDNDMEITTLTGVTLDEQDSGSDTEVGIDDANYGAVFTYDGEDKQSLSVVYPGLEHASASMYISPVTAVVSGAGNVPVVKDTELGASKTTKNLVVVGGPAVNSVAAELLGLSFPTYGDAPNSGFAPDTAMIKLLSGTDNKISPNNVALLVAGYEAKDTSAAAKALIAEKKYGTLTTTTASTYSYAA